MASPLHRQRSDASLEVLGTPPEKKKERKKSEGVLGEGLPYLSHRISLTAYSTRSVDMPWRSAP